MTAPNTTYPQDTLARQILADGFLREPSGYINGNLAGAFGFADIRPDQISPETLALAQHCGITHIGEAVWVYTSAYDQRTPDEIAAVRASIAAAEAAPVPSPAAPATPSEPAPIAQPETGPTDAAPAPEAPALVLTKERHEQTRSLMQKIGDEVHHLSDEAKTAFAKLVALLHHV